MTASPQPNDPPPTVPSTGPGLTLPPISAPRAGARAPAATVDPGADWPTYHGDTAGTGYLPAPARPAPANMGLAWQARLDGAVYASPIVVSQQVIAATEGGSVYGLDARTGAVRWRTHLADPLPGTALPCGDITPIGITGTPVYDPASNQVFAVTTQAGVTHVLYALDATTGAVHAHRPVDPPGADPATHLQRGALRVSQGRVYIPYGGNYGDCGQYRGRVVAAATNGLGPLSAFTVPTNREAGIWAPPGPGVLPNGDIIVTTGNGDATGGAWDHSDSLLRLSPGLGLIDGFAPPGWAQDNSTDADLGSTGPVLLPGTHTALTAGKGGSIYQVDLAHLGGVGGQHAHLPGCRSYGGAAAAPVTGGGSVAYLPCQSGLPQVRVGTDGTMVAGWHAPPQITGSPIIVGDTVWSLQQDGALDGLDAATGTVRTTVQVGDASRFATPAATGDALFLPTNHGISAVGTTPTPRPTPRSRTITPH